jgi:hypothetical protein
MWVYSLLKMKWNSDTTYKNESIGESPLNRNDPKSEQYSLDLLKRVIPNFQSVWRHRSELGFVPVKGTLPYQKHLSNEPSQSSHISFQLFYLTYTGNG